MIAESLVIAALLHKHAEVTVQPGDTLSGITSRICGPQGNWQGTWLANRAKLADPNLILPGQQFAVPCVKASVPAPATTAYVPKHVAVPAVPAGKDYGVSYGYPNFCGDGDNDGFDVDCQQQQAPSYQPQHAATASAPVFAASASGTYPGGSFGACVVARESGGNAQVMNSTGHYGLYQFSASTWAAYGGSPAAFGNASAAQQNQVFANALARGGQSNWSPYDGC